MFGQFLTSMAFFNYGGVLADDADKAHALLKAAATAAREVGAAHIELRQEELQQSGLSDRKKVSMRWRCRRTTKPC